MNNRKFFKFLSLVFLQIFLCSIVIEILYYCFKINIFIMDKRKVLLIELGIDILFICLLAFIYRKTLLNDLKDYFKNFKSYYSIAIKYWLIGLAFMLLCNLLIPILFKDVTTSQNEAGIQNLLRYAPLYVFFSGCIYAPFVEELIYRKSIKDFIKNKWVFIIISGLLFGLMHSCTGLITNPDNYNFIQLVYTLPYAIMGCVFAYMYTKTDNIFVSITAHLTHNLITYIISVIPLIMAGAIW